MNDATEDELREAARAFEAGAAGVPVLQNLCACRTGDANLHFLLGALLERQGRFADALQALDRTLQLDPERVPALGAKAAALRGLGRQKEAILLLVDAAARQPLAAELWTNLGVLREAVGEFGPALDAYDRAIALSEASMGACMNRGYVLTRLGRLGDALENNQRIAALYPDNADLHFNVAEVLLALHRYQEAAEACGRALELRPDHAKALIDRAVALAAQGEVEEAQYDLDRAARISPHAMDAFNLGFAERAGGILQDFGAYSIYFHLRYELLESCEWKHREELMRSVVVQANQDGGSARGIADPNIPFRTLGFDLPGSIQQTIARSIATAIETRAQAQYSALRKPVSRRKSRIRLGYASPDFRIHPAAFLTRRLYGGHDRSRFEVFGYALAPDDGSWIRRELQSGFDTFRDMGTQDASSIARQMEADGIDIAIDLAGYTNFSRSGAFALRPAPLQVNWLGFPGTLGAGFIDYALVDGIVCPPGDDPFWTEKLIRLPNTYFITDNDPRYEPAGMVREKVGLPADGFVFCCFNNAWKIEPRIFSVWMDLLKEVPGSVLWLLAFRPEVIVNLRREAGARGVDPDRLILGGRLPNEVHLARYGIADIFLDTLYYNAHTTAIDALREGTPVITAPGQTMPSRVAASLLSAAGMPELVCATLGEYRDKALALARNPEELARIRSKLKQGRGSTPLFDTPRFIRNLETAYELMWSRHLQGLPPEAFEVREVPKRQVSSRWF